MFEVADDPARPLNTLVLADDGQLTTYRKIHLYDSFGYHESDTVSPGPMEPCRVEVRGFPVGLMTCYDLRFPELARTLVEQGAEALVVPAAWVAGDAQGRALAHPAACPGDREHGLGHRGRAAGPRYTGHSMVVAPDGDVVVEAGDEDERARRGHRPARRSPTYAAPTLARQPPALSRRRASRAVGILPGVPTVRERAGPPQGGAAPSGRLEPPDEPARARDASAVDASPATSSPSADRAGARPRALRGLGARALAVAVGLAPCALVDAPAASSSQLAAALGVLLAIGLAVRSGGRALPAGARRPGRRRRRRDPVAGSARGRRRRPPACSPPAWPSSPRARRTSGRRSSRSSLAAAAWPSLGALGVAGFSVDLDPERFAYTVSPCRCRATVALVYRLGGGLHGLGRRGPAGAARLGAAGGGSRLHRRADPLRVPGAASTRSSRPGTGCATTWAAYPTRSRCCSASPPSPGACPCAPGAARAGGSARSARPPRRTATTRLLEDGVSPPEVALAAAYSLVLGLLLGFVLIRVERLLTGRPGRRAADAAEAAFTARNPRGSSHCTERADLGG